MEDFKAWGYIGLSVTDVSSSGEAAIQVVQDCPSVHPPQGFCACLRGQALHLLGKPLQHGDGLLHLGRQHPAVHALPFRPLCSPIIPDLLHHPDQPVYALHLHHEVSIHSL